MTKTKAVLFDLGGVIIDVDYQKTIDAFSELGVPNASELYNQFGQSRLFDAFEVGQVSSEGFLEELSQLVGPSVRKEDIEHAWNTMIGAYPPEKLELLKEISSRIPCYMLSNTNEIHLKKAMQALQGTPYPKLDLFFEKCFFSHLIGRRKPDTDTFLWVAGQLGRPPGEILFIDDSPQHVEGARKAGMQTIFYKSIGDIEKIMEVV